MNAKLQNTKLIITNIDKVGNKVCQYQNFIEHDILERVVHQIS